ncbi:MAG: hypothetical protein ACLFS8_03150 [Clostridia bacterium]
MTSSSRFDSSPRRCRPTSAIIVGPCASGKTTLAEALRELGYDAQSMAQEHSSIRRMYARRDRDYLIYLDVGYDEIRRRRHISWGPNHLMRQRRRLRWAKEDADLVIDTDGKRPRQVLAEVLAFIREGREPDDSRTERNPG